MKITEKITAAAHAAGHAMKNAASGLFCSYRASSVAPSITYVRPIGTSAPPWSEDYDPSLDAKQAPYIITGKPPHIISGKPNQRELNGLINTRNDITFEMANLDQWTNWAVGVENVKRIPAQYRNIVSMYQRAHANGTTQQAHENLRKRLQEIDNQILDAQTEVV